MVRKRLSWIREIIIIFLEVWGWVVSSIRTKVQGSWEGRKEGVSIGKKKKRQNSPGFCISEPEPLLACLGLSPEGAIGHPGNMWLQAKISKSPSGHIGFCGL